MNPYMHAELCKIAEALESSPFFQALDKLANVDVAGGRINAPGSSMGKYQAPPTPKAVQPSSVGATSMAGMSVHCDKCFGEIKAAGAKFCPHCGNRIKAVRDIKSAPKNGNADGEEAEGVTSGPTGGPESVSEDLAEGSQSDMGKYSAAAKTLMSKAYDATLGHQAHPLLKKLRTAGVIGGGLYLGYKGHKALSGAQQPQRPIYKQAGVPFKRGSRFAQLHFKPKGGSYSSVDAGLRRISKATSKHVKRIAARSVARK